MMKIVSIITLFIFSFSAPLPLQVMADSNPIVEYFVIFYPSISPNGDGVKDTSPVKLRITTPCNYISLTLEDTLLTTVFDTLFAASNPDTGEYSFEWTGLDSTASLLPEGAYLLHLYSTNDTSSWNDYREVYVDITAPGVRIDRIEPGIYLPGIPGKEERVLIYYTLTDIGDGDSLTASISWPDETVEILEPEWEGPGSYSISWSGDVTLPDGYYSVYFRMDDEAGNGSSDEAFFEVDNAGPAIAFIDSVAHYANHTPDVMEGTCFDRNGVKDIALTWNNSSTFPPDSTLAVGDTIHWFFNIGDSVRADGEYIEGQYKLEVSCSDSFDHDSKKVMSFYIDTTPPPPPHLNPPPPRVNERELMIIGVSDENEADSVFIYHTNGVDTVLIKKKLMLDEFSATLDLFDGDNTVWALAKDMAGNFSTPSNSINVEYRVTDETTFPEVFRSPGYFKIYSTRQIQAVEIRIFTINGELVRKLYGHGPAEKVSVYWNLLNEDGVEVNNGPYLVVITTEYQGSRKVEKKIIAVVR